MALLAVALVAPRAMAAGSFPLFSNAQASAPLALGSQQSATARCPKYDPQVTGGGWFVARPFNPNGSDDLADDTGTRTMHLQSQSTRRGSWTAGVGTFTVPSSPGTLTTTAQCEPKAAGKLVKGPSEITTIPVGQSATVDMHCRPGSHVLSGGYSGSPPGNLANPNEATGLIVLESRRIAADTWEVRAVNSAAGSGQATLATNAVCERNAPQRIFCRVCRPRRRSGFPTGVSEAQAVAPIPDNGRVVGMGGVGATCPGKGVHAISGGFLVSPTSPSPAVGIDSMGPGPPGNKGWFVGLYEYPFTVLPPGSTLTVFIYCKKNK
jgi:hypothetical protein